MPASANGKDKKLHFHLTGCPPEARGHDEKVYLVAPSFPQVLGGNPGYKEFYWNEKTKEFILSEYNWIYC